MSPFSETILAAACSGCMIALLYRMAMGNRASGWRRHRHPSCYEPLKATPAVSVAADPSRPAPVYFSQQLTALAQAIGQPQASPAEPVVQNQNAVFSDKRATLIR